MKYFIYIHGVDLPYSNRLNNYPGIDQHKKGENWWE